jgi:hypothetical protein
MKLSAIKAEGYDGLHANCNTCRTVTEIPFSKLPDGEFMDIAERLICKKCGSRPTVTSYQSQTKSMAAKGLGRK